MLVLNVCLMSLNNGMERYVLPVSVQYQRVSQTHLFDYWQIGLFLVIPCRQAHLKIQMNLNSPRIVTTSYITQNTTFNVHVMWGILQLTIPFPKLSYDNTKPSKTALSSLNLVGTLDLVSLSDETTRFRELSRLSRRWDIGSAFLNRF